MSDNPNRPLRVFLCHASNDKPEVRKLYLRLIKDGIDAWLDKEKLIPGQNWQIEIPKSVRNSDIVLVCLSSQSVNKEGFVQKEIKIALDAADEKPEGTIFIVPARLEECSVPERIGQFHWVDLYSRDGYEQLWKALQVRANHLGLTLTRKKISVLPVMDAPSIGALLKDTPDKINEQNPTTVSNDSIVGKSQEHSRANFEKSKTGTESYLEKKYGRFWQMPRFKIGIALGFIGSSLPFIVPILIPAGYSDVVMVILLGLVMGGLSGYLTTHFETIKLRKEGGKAGLSAGLFAEVGFYLGFPLANALYFRSWSSFLPDYVGDSLVVTSLILLPVLVLGYFFGYYSVPHIEK